MSGEGVPGELVPIIRPDNDVEGEEFTANPARVGVLRSKSDRGYYQTQVRSAYESNHQGETYVKLFERSTGEEMVGIAFSENNVRIMQHGPNNRGWQSIRDVVGPKADIVDGASFNRDEARAIGEDLLYFADNGRLPGPPEK